MTKAHVLEGVSFSLENVAIVTLFIANDIHYEIYIGSVSQLPKSQSKMILINRGEIF